MATGSIVNEVRGGQIWQFYAARYSVPGENTPISIVLPGTNETLTKNVTLPIVAIGTAATKSAMEVDEGYDIIIKKTGASGDALKDMEERAKNLTTTIPTDFKTAGEAIGEVNYINNFV